MINVTKSYLPDKEKYFSYIDKIYRNGWLTNNGPLVQELEKRLASYLNVKHVILVSNGTTALELSFKALNVKGKVITTPFSFVATTNAIIYSSLTPVFADIDAETFNINPANVEELITPDTDAIVPVHVFGNACDVEKLDDIASKHDLKIIYDAAHAFGIEYKSHNILKYGDISTLSFHATKLFHTIEGGAIITNDDSLAHKVELLRNFGISGAEEVQLPGTNAKMNEFEAAMGLCILDDIDKIIEGRRRIVELYRELLADVVEFQRQNPDATRNFSYFPVLFESAEQRSSVQRSLQEKEIYPRRYFFPSLDTLPYIQCTKPMQISRDIAERILCLPLYPDLSLHTVANIASIIKNTCQQSIKGKHL